MVTTVQQSSVEYQFQSNDNITNPLITGYQVTRFGVPMIGEYVNPTRRRVTISPAVPGAQYKITVWALLGRLGDGRRSSTPAVKDVTIKETSECGMNGMHYLLIIII